MRKPAVKQMDLTVFMIGRWLRDATAGIIVITGLVTYFTHTFDSARSLDMSLGKNTRRDFLKATTAVGVGFWVSGAPAEESKSPNEKVRFACIGIKGKGESDSGDAGRLGDVVAICDVDDSHL